MISFQISLMKRSQTVQKPWEHSHISSRTYKVARTYKIKIKEPTYFNPSCPFLQLFSDGESFTNSLDCICCFLKACFVKIFGIDLFVALKEVIPLITDFVCFHFF